MLLSSCAMRASSASRRAVSAAVSGLLNGCGVVSADRGRNGRGGGRANGCAEETSEPWRGYDIVLAGAGLTDASLDVVPEVETFAKRSLRVVFFFFGVVEFASIGSVRRSLSATTGGRVDLITGMLGVGSGGTTGRVMVSAVKLGRCLMELVVSCRRCCLSLHRGGDVAGDEAG